MTDLEWTPVVVRLGDLAHWAENPVTLTKAQAKKLLKSTKRLGRMQTLAIGPPNGDGKYLLYDGHQRCNVWGGAFGMDLEVNALQSNRPLTDEERHEVPILLRTAAGSLDYDVLAGWTEYNLRDLGLDLDVLRSLNNDAMNLREMIQGEGDPDNPQDEWQGMPEFENNEALGAIHSIKVHFATIENINAFSKLIAQPVTNRTKYIWYPKQANMNLKELVAHES